MSPLVKNILIILFLAAVAMLGAYLYLNEDNFAEPLLSSLSSGEGVSSDALLETDNFLLQFQAFESVELDDSLFTDERFRSLSDFRQPVIPTAIGRPNPYLPVR